MVGRPGESWSWAVFEILAIPVILVIPVGLAVLENPVILVTLLIPVIPVTLVILVILVIPVIPESPMVHLIPVGRAFVFLFTIL